MALNTLANGFIVAIGSSPKQFELHIVKKDGSIQRIVGDGIKASHTKLVEAVKRSGYVAVNCSIVDISAINPTGVELWCSLERFTKASMVGVVLSKYVDVYGATKGYLLYTIINKASCTIETLKKDALASRIRSKTFFIQNARVEGDSGELSSYPYHPFHFDTITSRSKVSPPYAGAGEPVKQTVTPKVITEKGTQEVKVQPKLAIEGAEEVPTVVNQTIKETDAVMTDDLTNLGILLSELGLPKAEETLYANILGKNDTTVTWLRTAWVEESADPCLPSARGKAALVSIFNTFVRQNKEVDTLFLDTVFALIKNGYNYDEDWANMFLADENKFFELASELLSNSFGWTDFKATRIPALQDDKYWGAGNPSVPINEVDSCFIDISDDAFLKAAEQGKLTPEEIALGVK